MTNLCRIMDLISLFRAKALEDCRLIIPALKGKVIQKEKDQSYSYKKGDKLAHNELPRPLGRG